MGGESGKVQRTQMPMNYRTSWSQPQLQVRKTPGRWGAPFIVSHAEGTEEEEFSTCIWGSQSP